MGRALLSIAVLLLFLPAPSLAVPDASYPDTCPAAAKAVLDALGGCPAVNASQYPAINEKCCSLPKTSESSPGPAATPAARSPGFEAVLALNALGVAALLRRRVRL